MGNTEWGSPIPLLLILRPLGMHSPEPFNQSRDNSSKVSHVAPLLSAFSNSSSQFNVGKAIYAVNNSSSLLSWGNSGGQSLC